MVKNLFLLVLLTWVSIVYARPFVVQESMGEAESFKVEKAVEQQQAQRAVAGDKIKKKRSGQLGAEEVPKEFKDESDSEVRYWEYSE